MHTSLWDFFIASTLVMASPGTDTALVLSSTLREGLKTAFGVIAGVLIGTFSWGVANSLGLCALLNLYPEAYTPLKWVAAMWLAWLGIKMFLPQDRKLDYESEDSSPKHSQEAGFLAGLKIGAITDLLNPETGIFTLTFFPPFIPAGANPPLYSLMLTFITMGECLVLFTALAFLARPMSGFLKRPDIARYLDWATGVVFLLLCVKLLTGS
ncbi:LysE family translocator [Acetobacteraceae bacterium]|nr:LysE family translocator [Acetobacteraceae bacterium]